MHFSSAVFKVSQEKNGLGIVISHKPKWEEFREDLTQMENKERVLTMKAEKAEDGRSCEAESRSMARDRRAVSVRETAALLKMFNNSRSPKHLTLSLLNILTLSLLNILISCLRLDKGRSHTITIVTGLLEF